MTKIKKLAHIILSKYNIDLSILDKYNEPHRFYHNWDHIEYMINLCDRYKYTSEDLLLAIIFHDIIYDPKENDNEEKSAELFYSMFSNMLSDKDGNKIDIDVDKIKQAILDTKYHNKFSSEISEQLCELDLYNLYDNFDVFY